MLQGDCKKCGGDGVIVVKLSYGAFFKPCGCKQEQVGVDDELIKMIDKLGDYGQGRS